MRGIQPGAQTFSVTHRFVVQLRNRQVSATSAVVFHRLHLTQHHCRSGIQLGIIGFRMQSVYYSMDNAPTHHFQSPNGPYTFGHQAPKHLALLTGRRLSPTFNCAGTSVRLHLAALTQPSYNYRCEQHWPLANRQASTTSPLQHPTLATGVVGFSLRPQAGSASPLPS